MTTLENYYPTASNIACFINGLHIDEAYQIQFRELSNKVPIYGYNDFEFSKIAYGKRLVEGTLVIAFKFAGYLNVAIDDTYNNATPFVSRLYNYDISKKNDKKVESNILTELKSELPANDTTENRAARAAYIASLITKDKVTKEMTKQALLKQFNVVPVDSKVKELQSPITLDNEGIILDVYYNDPTYATWFLRFYNVHFHQVSQVGSQAGADGSSEPLYEIYNWMASKREIRLLQR